MPVESVPEEGSQTSEGEDEAAQASQPTGTFKPSGPPGSTGSASPLLQATAATKKVSPLLRSISQGPFFVDKQEYVQGALRAPYFDAWGRPVAFGGEGGGGGEAGVGAGAGADGRQHGQGGQGGVSDEAYAYEPYQLRDPPFGAPIHGLFLPLPLVVVTTSLCVVVRRCACRMQGVVLS